MHISPHHYTGGLLTTYISPHHYTGGLLTMHVSPHHYTGGLLTMHASPHHHTGCLLTMHVSPHHHTGCLLTMHVSPHRVTCCRRTGSTRRAPSPSGRSWSSVGRRRYVRVSGRSAPCTSTSNRPIRRTAPLSPKVRAQVFSQIKQRKTNRSIRAGTNFFSAACADVSFTVRRHIYQPR